ncbi:MAG: hypothetical protein ACTSW5_04930 [Promethearchaeota archaeon]
MTNRNRILGIFLLVLLTLTSLTPRARSISRDFPKSAENFNTSDDFRG